MPDELAVEATHPNGAILEAETPGPSVDESPVALAPGEVSARITGVRKSVTNYETFIAYEIETQVSVTSSRVSFRRHTSMGRLCY